MPARPADPCPPRRRQRGLARLSVVLIYAAVATLWILFSDQAVEWLFGNSQQLIVAGTLKGLVFVVVTSLLLYALLHQSLPIANPPPLKPQSRLPFALLALSVVTLTGASIFYTVEQHRNEEISRLQDIANLKQQQTDDWLAEREADARFIRSSLALSQEQPGAVQARLDALQQSHGFYALTLLAADGQPLQRTSQAPRRLAPAVRAALQAGGQRAEIQRIGPYRDDDQRVRFDFVIPIPGTGGIQTIAILHIDPQARFYTMLQAWPGPAASGETVLFRRAGDEVLILNQLRHQADTAATMRLPIAGSDYLSARALRGDYTPGTPLIGRDYRGTEVIGVVRPIEGSDWMLLAKMDRREFHASAYQSAFWIALAGLLALFISGVGLLLMRQRQQLLIASQIQQAQNERIDAMNLLSTIADRSHDGIFAKDLEGRYIFCNRAAAEMSHLAPETLLGHDDTLLFPPEQAARVRQMDQETLADQHWHRYQESITRDDGSLVTLEITKSPLYDQQGKLIGVFGIARDISDRVGAEQALRDSEKQFHTLFDNAAVAITVRDAESGDVVLANRRAIESYGYTTLDELQQNPLWCEAPYRASDALQHIQRAASQGSQRFEWKKRNRHGEVFWEDVLLDRIQLDGKMRVISITTDITERKAMELALRHQAAELAERNRELERFNRATIGRELDMIALKQQVNALATELGRAPPHALDFLDAEPASKDAP